MKKADLKIGDWVLTSTQVWGPMQVMELMPRQAALRGRGREFDQHIGYSAITRRMTEEQAEQYVADQKAQDDATRARQRLNKAAPDLLAELETCRRILAGRVILDHVARAAVAKADAAIAKAKGEA